MLESRGQRWLVYLLFFLSGSSGLIYEIIWTRKLTLVFGGTVFAVSTVLTVYFTGLALGAMWIGRQMDRGRDPARSYIVLEFLIGLFGLLSPLIFVGIDAIYYQVQPLVGTGLFGLTAVRFVLSFLGLLIPTTLMGATLPVLVKLVVRDDSSVASNAGHLYALNTLGAALGTVLAAIVLVPAFGVNGSLYFAGVVNLMIGVVALVLFRNAPAPARVAAPPVRTRTPLQQRLLVLFGVIGFLSMVYQVAWIRLLIQVTGSTVYTFGLMLSVFIVGVGLGSEAATRMLPRIKSPIAALAGVEIVASVYALWTLSAFERLPFMFASWVSQYETFGELLFVKVVITALVLFVPTLMFGAAFPLVAQVYANKSESSGGDTGLVYFSNTIGGVFGSFVGGFFILPWLATQRTIAATSVLGLVVAGLIVLLLTEKRQRMAGLAVCTAALVVGLGLYRTWDIMTINSAPYLLQYADADALARKLQNDEHLFYYEEGINVNVAVTGEYRPRSIFINGKPMATTLITDVANQYLLGHIPMLLHPDPKRSMVIGLGAGMTFGALARHGEPADVIEISPEIVEGARHFGPYNRDVLDQPNANVIFDDGRNYLKTTRQKYDVITEDPLDPFFMGSGYLYDKEHFENAKRALNPGGVMCQYLPLYQVGVTEARIIVKTFHEVFPYVTAWFAFNDLILIGTEEPLRIDLKNLRRRMARPEIAQDMREVGIDDEYDFLANLLFDETAIAEIGEGLPLNTDDYPIIEYMTPRALMRRTMFENVDFFLGMRFERFPTIVDITNLSPAEFDTFSRRMAQHYRARTNVIAAHLKLLKGGRGIMPLLEQAQRDTAPWSTSSHYIAYVYLARGLAMLGGGRHAEAIELLRRAALLRPGHPETLAQLGLALIRNGQRVEGLELLRASLETDDMQVEPRVPIADQLISEGDFAGARSLLEGCLALDPENRLCAARLDRLTKAPG